MEEEYIRLVFGLKLKQARTQRELSLFDLAKLTGLSKSYLNEIEKGKKYPKTDKIVVLADKLAVSYDSLVSLKLDKKLAPVGELLQSNILKELPLELFGVKESDVIDIVANAPTKVNAFIATIIEIAKHYNFGKENFYLAALRSYQEAHHNYFPELEKAVIAFAQAHHLDLTQSVSSEVLAGILVDTYHYQIDHEGLVEHAHYDNLRSVYLPNSRRLVVSHQLDEAQRTFIYAKELAYNWLTIKERLYTFTWIKFENFEQVLHNLYASYFAGALIIPKEALQTQLRRFLAQKRFNLAYLGRMNLFFNASPESLYQRLTNLLPAEYNIDHLFFLRFEHRQGTAKFSITKELHLTQQHAPHGNGQNETYCRRWASIRVLETIAKSEGESHIMEVQISNYPADGVKYLIFSSATKDPFKDGFYRSVGIGLKIDDRLRKTVKFIDDPKIKTYDVGVTCERCPIKDCKERAAKPTQLEKDLINTQIEGIVYQLQQEDLK